MEDIIMAGAFLKHVFGFDELGDALKREVSAQNCKAFLCSNEADSSLEDYCLYHQRCLSKLREKKNFSNSEIQRLETFKTWFNGNCGYVIIKRNGSFFLWLVIYEPALRNMEENLTVDEYSSDSSLWKVELGVKEFEERLQNDDFHATPLLDINRLLSNTYVNFDDMLLNGKVIKSNLPCRYERFLWNVSSSAPVNAELYLKPLDIVWVKRSHENWEKSYYHVGVYLGKWSGENWMCHLDGDGRGAETITWERFLKSGTCEELIRFHPVIPFKNYSKIARQIAWVVENNYGRGNYNLANHNCEHFANMLVYGVNYSKQVEDSKGELVAKNIIYTVASPLLALTFNNYSLNNGKGSTIKLTNEMEESNDKLGCRIDDWSKLVEEQYLQEVPPKENCRIM